MNLFLFSFATFFSVINPQGTFPVFMELTLGYSNNKRNHIANWASCNTCVILTLPFYLGTCFFRFLIRLKGVLRNERTGIPEKSNIGNYPSIRINNKRNLFYIKKIFLIKVVGLVQ
jgi:hypothetical protein